VPDHDSFFVISRQTPEDGRWIVTVLHEVPPGARELGTFADPAEAVDFAQEEVRRMNAAGIAADYVDPPDDLVGAG
jgi:hypothetical protein